MNKIDNTGPHFKLSPDLFTPPIPQQQPRVTVRTSTRHERTVWVRGDVDFGGVVVEGVTASAAAVVWPYGVTFSSADVQQRAEALLTALAADEEARRRLPGRRGA